jgi:excisionase family DNA binding protein
MMTNAELCAYLRLDETAIRKYAAGGKPPATRDGKVWRFDKNAIDEWFRGD